jgi:hypothetical protein
MDTRLPDRDMQRAADPFPGRGQDPVPQASGISQDGLDEPAQSGTVFP